MELDLTTIVWVIMVLNGFLTLSFALYSILTKRNSYAILFTIGLLIITFGIALIVYSPALRSNLGSSLLYLGLVGIMFAVSSNQAQWNNRLFLALLIPAILVGVVLNLQLIEGKPRAVLVAYLMAYYFLFAGFRLLRMEGTKFQKVIGIFYIFCGLPWLIKEFFPTQNIVHVIGYSTGVFMTVATSIGFILLLKEKDENSLRKAIVETASIREILYTLIDNIPLYVGIFDRDGKYLMVNSKYEPTFKMKREEIIGRHLREVIPKENIPDYEAMLNRALAGEEVEIHRKTILKSGEYIYAHGKYVPILDESGNVKYVTVFLLDISKLEEARQALDKANKEKERLLALVSHDIRGPLGNIYNLLQMSQQFEPGQFQNVLNHIMRDFTVLMNSITELLDWAKAQLKSTELMKEQIALGDIIRNTLPEFKLQLESKKIAIKQELAEAMALVDKNHMIICFRNVLQNAIKFSPDNSTITVGVAKGDSQTMLYILDEGSGMAKDKIEDILQGNMVSSSQGTKGEKGTGLGLSMVVELINRNGGSMEITNTVPSGTRIAFTFDGV